MVQVKPTSNSIIPPPTDRPGADFGAPGGQLSCARITVLAPTEQSRAWAKRLCEALGAQFGLPTELARLPAAAPARPLPSEALERRIYHHDHGLAELVSTHAWPAATAGAWTDRLVFNLTGEDPARLPSNIRSATVLTPAFDGDYAIEALAPRLLAGRIAHLGVVATRHRTNWLLQGALAAAPDPEVLPAALDALLGRMIELLIGAAEHLLAGKPLPPPAPLPETAAGSGALLGPRRLAAVTAPKLARKLVRPIVRQDWGIGYRRSDAEYAPDAARLSPADFRFLDCPSNHFYADPFVFRHDGVTALFFEDFDYGSGLGSIAHVVLGEDGPCSEVVETLKRPYHLSYPFLFGHEGAALMIPESGAAGAVELYEAEEFPARWRLRSVLLEGLEAADTTAHFQAETGLWWLFSSVTRFGSCSHDTLSLFYSDRLEGPWRAHPGNPVKLDPASSRPAGPLVSWEGRLLRPAQDCTRAYGGGLTWCEIDELTPTSFRERVVARSPAPPGYTGLHTYGRAAGFEVIDFVHARSPLAARLAERRRARARQSAKMAKPDRTGAGLLRFFSLTASPPLALGAADYGEWGAHD